MNLKNKQILQSFIIPICRQSRESKNIDFLYGTAFFTSLTGVFITAKHVYTDMIAAKKQNEEYNYGLCVKGKNNENLLTFMDKVEFDPTGLDIAIGKVNFVTTSPIKLVRDSLYFLQEASTCGYPVTATGIDHHPEPAYWIDLRGHKGYINREVSTKAMEIAGHKGAVELSFRMEAGISGAPLFISNDYLVGGVCLGTNTVEQYEYRISQGEKVPRHTEYGVACILVPLPHGNLRF